MRTFALIEDGKVVNISVADETWSGNGWIICPENMPIGVGFSYDPIDDAFIPPIPCDHASLTLTNDKKWYCPECEALRLEAYPL